MLLSITIYFQILASIRPRTGLSSFGSDWIHLLCLLPIQKSYEIVFCLADRQRRRASERQPCAGRRWDRFRYSATLLAAVSSIATYASETSPPVVFARPLILLFSPSRDPKDAKKKKTKEKKNIFRNQNWSVYITKTPDRRSWQKATFPPSLSVLPIPQM